MQVEITLLLCIFRPS